MKKVNVQSILGIIIALLLGGAIAFAGSQGGATYNGVPVFVICGLLAFGMNWLGYIPSYIAQTEHYYDFMGSVTYVTLLLVAVTLTEEMDNIPPSIMDKPNSWKIRFISSFNNPAICR